MQAKQKRATERELRLARDYGGERVKGSGSGKLKKGDVSFANALLQDKHTIRKSISIKKSDLELIEQEAMTRGKVPFFSIGFEDREHPYNNRSSVTWFAFPEWWLKNNGDFLKLLTEREEPCA